jgi:hypothetical protein
MNHPRGSSGSSLANLAAPLRVEGNAKAKKYLNEQLDYVGLTGDDRL